MSSRGGNDGRPPREDGDGVFVERVQTGKIAVARDTGRTSLLNAPRPSNPGKAAVEQHTPRRVDPRSEEDDESTSGMVHVTPPSADERARLAQMAQSWPERLDPDKRRDVVAGSTKPKPATPSAPVQAAPASQPARAHGSSQPAQPSRNEPIERDVQDKLQGVEELYAVLKTANHYKLLGIATNADPKEIRNAYFSGSKRFHPDAFFRKNIGDYRSKLEAVFDALTLAYETLRRTSSRKEYDDSIKLAESERYVAPPNASAKEPPPPVESESNRVQREVNVRESSQPPRPVNPLSTPVRPANQPERTLTAPAQVARVSERPPASAPTSAKPVATPVAARAPERAAVVPEAPSAPVRNSFPGEVSTGTGRNFVPERTTGSRNFVAERSTGNMRMPDDPGTGQRASLPGEPRPAASASSPAGAAKSTGFEEKSTLLRELDALMQQKLRQSLAPDSSVVRRTPEGGNAVPFSGSTTGSLPTINEGPTLLDLANQLKGGGGLRNWASQRLKEAHNEELQGHVVDAANIVRIVLAQLKDPDIELQSQRLQRLVSAKTAPAHKARARSAEKEGRWNDAAECWEKVRDASPNDGYAAFAHARALMQIGDFKNAGRAAMRAAEIAPNHIETRELLVEFFEKMGMKLNARREKELVMKLLEARANAK